MVHTDNLDALKQVVEDIKWHKEQIKNSEVTLDDICCFDAEGNGQNMDNTVFSRIAYAFNGQAQLAIPVNSRFSLSLFPMKDDSVLVVTEEDDKASAPAYVWNIENLGIYLATNGYLEYFDGISEEDFIASVLIESLEY